MKDLFRNLTVIIGCISAFSITNVKTIQFVCNFLWLGVNDILNLPEEKEYSIQFSAKSLLILSAAKSQIIISLLHLTNCSYCSRIIPLTQLLAKTNMHSITRHQHIQPTWPQITQWMAPRHLQRISYRIHFQV